MQEILETIKQGGITVYPLIICSIIALAVIIEKLIVLRKKRILMPEIEFAIKRIKSIDDVPEAIAVCNQNPGVFANLILSGLKLADQPLDIIRESFADQGRQEIRHLEKGLVLLETVAAISPLLGLLGTVIGMIKVFKIISERGVGEASSLSGGISEALLSTAVGLTVGIPALVFYNYFTSKSEDIILDIEKSANGLMQKLHCFQNENKPCDS
jgi:biopolymer transport protein ExbB